METRRGRRVKQNAKASVTDTSDNAAHAESHETVYGFTPLSKFTNSIGLQEMVLQRNHLII